MTIGAGAQSAGGTNAGYGVPSVPPALGGAVTNNEIGVPTGARRIDPRIKDYVLDANGRTMGMTVGQQSVYLAVQTVLDSSAVKGMGQTLRQLDRITDNFKDACDAKLRGCLQQCVDLGLIAYLGFTTFKAGPKDGLQPGQTYGRLQWRDLSTGQEIVSFI